MHITPVFAAIDLIPLLFLAYVVIAVFTSLARAARQAAARSSGSEPPPAPGTAAQAQINADQIRAALERRLAAAAARAAAAQAPAAQPMTMTPTPIVQTIQAAPPASALAPALFAAPPALLSVPLEPATAAPADLKTLLTSLPPAAQAIVASAVIGPCAAHRGGGHQPEDW